MNDAPRVAVSYARQTVDAPNPLARFAHRNRLRRALALALTHLRTGKLLDYGCGSGDFLSKILACKPECAVGYEPYMLERVRPDLPIYSNLEQIELIGPYSVVTLFETLEHLTQVELESFCSLCNRVLTKLGGILISAPIEIGPALLLKDLNRSRWGALHSEHRPLELLKASLFGIAARRTTDIKHSHRGFDFRRARATLEHLGWKSRVLAYGPVPVLGWYGNSQVYLWAERRERT